MMTRIEIPAYPGLKYAVMGRRRSRTIRFSVRRSVLVVALLDLGLALCIFALGYRAGLGRLFE